MYKVQAWFMFLLCVAVFTRVRCRGLCVFEVRKERVEGTRGMMRAITDSLRFGREPLSDCLSSLSDFSNELPYSCSVVFSTFWFLLLPRQYGSHRGRQQAPRLCNHKPLFSTFSPGQMENKSILRRNSHLVLWRGGEHRGRYRWQC